MTTQKKTIRIWPVALFVLLAMGGTVIAGMCFAKMVSEPIVADASMDVAKWDVSAEGAAENNISLVAGSVAQTYIFTVTNDSDVATDYTVTVSNVPNGMKIGIDDDELIFATDGVVTFSGMAPLAANSSKDHMLKFVATLNSAVVTGEDLAININYTQEEL